MTDRDHVEKAAEAGVRKAALLQEDPLRYMLRAVGAGMGLTLVVFVFWVLQHNLQELAVGAVIASGFFGVGLVIIVFTNTELFTSNNMYLTVSSAEGLTSWRQTTMLWGLCYLGILLGAILLAALLVGAGSLGKLPSDHALFEGALHKAHQAGSVIFFKGILANWIVWFGGTGRSALQGGGGQDPGLDFLLSSPSFIRLRTFNRQYGTFSMAILGGGTVPVSEALHNLLYSTAGNVLGGVLLVGLPFTYLNPRERHQQMRRVD